MKRKTAEFKNINTSMSDTIADGFLGEYKYWPNPNADLISYGIYWKIKAEEFRVASEVIWKQMQADWQTQINRNITNTVDKTKLSIHLDSVYMLLIGFALENVLKGILIHKRPDNISRDKLTGNNFKKHKLIEVVKDCEISLNEAENKLCDICSIYISGYGRYPIPKKTSDTIQSMHLSFGKINLTFTTLYKRLGDYMEKIGAVTKPGI